MSLADVIQEYGVKNVRFVIPMRRLQLVGLIPGIAIKSSDTPEEQVLCAIDEYRYRIVDNYKISLRAEDPSFGVEHFYLCDLRLLLTRSPDTFRMYVLTSDGYSRFEPAKL